MAEQSSPSRLVVLSLPSQLTTAELAAHFSSLNLPITDAKVLQKPDGQSRRVGFIGFNNGEDAQQAKNWFDGTWLRGARIKVDYAQEIRDTPPPRKRQRKLEQPSDASKRMDISQNQTSDSKVQHVEPALLSDATDSYVNFTDVIQEELSDADYIARRQKRTVGVEQGTAAEGFILESTQTDEDNSGSTSQPQEPAPDDHTDESRILQTGRLFLRNLAYTVRDEDLSATFQAHGQLLEARVLTNEAGASKGLAYVAYVDPVCALAAFKLYDSKAYHGRVLHILPSAASASMRLQDSQLPEQDKTSHKVAKARSQVADSEKGFNWSTLYLNSNAVMETLANRYNIDKAELIGAQSSSAAARLALAETHLIEETKSYLVANGVNLSSFEGTKDRSSTTLLLKNLPHATKATTIRSLLSPFGSPRRLLLVPSGTLAVVDMQSSKEATTAFHGLAYSKLGTTILYLEKAPSDIWVTQSFSSTAEVSVESEKAIIKEDNLQPQCSLFVKNLPHDYDSHALEAAFRHLANFVSATISREHDSKEVRLAGYGFVRFTSELSARLAKDAMDGAVIAGKIVSVDFAKRGQEDAEIPSGTSGASVASRRRLVVKNLPFEISKQDLRELLSIYGTIVAMRLPRKIDNGFRGFAFVQYATEVEATAALSGLKNTHILGRHLIVERTSD